MNEPILSLTCSDEEVVNFTLQHYFLPEQLAEAHRMLETGSTYEQAIAYLADWGLSSLRDSGEQKPPRIFITIPGGRVLVHHPAHPFFDRRVWQGNVSDLARLVLPRPAAEILSTAANSSHTVSGRYHPFSLFDDVPTTERSIGEKSKRPGSRSKKLRYLEQLVRMGTQKTSWTRPGWVVKDGYLGYVVEALKADFYQISLVHLKSNHVLATVYLSALDETTHQRIRGWVADALQLTDWSRGITAILREKTGEQKKRAWARQLEDLWMKHRTQRYQFSLFDTDDHT